jgi:cardiolipin synthase A/B
MKMRIPTRRREYSPGHSVELVRSGRQYFDTVEAIIDGADHFIHFHTYIIDEDTTGKRIVAALVRAARRGVRVYLLLDAFGTGYLSKEFIDSIENSGILLRFFSPTFITKGFHLSLRLHSKVVLADGEVAVIGGLNIADRYSGMHGKIEWLDFAVVIKGPECIYLLNILKKLWNRRFTPRSERSAETIPEPSDFSGAVRLKVLQNNWYRNKIEILKSYRSAFKSATERMIIFNSYFLPGRNERRLLRNASRRGVDISVVFAAVSDAPTFSRATHFLYSFILENNIKIYEYLPSNLHAKVAVVDGKWSSVGSYNLNHLSDYGSVEINADILDEAFSGSFEKMLTEIIRRDCREVTLEEYKRRNTLSDKIRGWLSYQTIRLMMRIMFRLTSRKGIRYQN